MANGKGYCPNVLPARALIHIFIFSNVSLQEVPFSGQTDCIGVHTSHDLFEWLPVPVPGRLRPLMSKGDKMIVVPMARERPTFALAYASRLSL